MALAETTDAMGMPRPADDGSDPFDTTDLRTQLNLIDAFVADKGADLASAAALTLPTTMDGHYFDVTGTTTITSISSKAAGIMIVLQFDGALTLTHNATTLMLPGGANIVTVAGDRAIFISEGGGNWRCLFYTPIQARQEWKKGADIASAATLAIGTDGNYFDVTGTTTITAFSGMIAGTIFATRFTGALTLTYSATDLILPGGVNILTVAGDSAIWVALSATTVRCLVFTPIQARVQWREGANIASVAAPVIGTGGNYFHITGTVTITSFSGMVAGTWFKLEFDGALTFTHHATNLDLPGDANITTVAGDVAFMYAKTATTAKCVHYARADGKAVVGGAGVTQSAIAAATTSGPSTTSTTYVDMSEMSVTLTATAGNHLLAWLYTSWDNTSGTGSINMMGLSLDAAAEVTEVSSQLAGSANFQQAASTFNRYASVAGGSRTIKGRWKVNGGTGGLELLERRLLVIEVTA